MEVLNVDNGTMKLEVVRAFCKKRGKIGFDIESVDELSINSVTNKAKIRFEQCRDVVADFFKKRDGDVFFSANYKENGKPRSIILQAKSVDMRDRITVVGSVIMRNSKRVVDGV